MFGLKMRQYGLCLTLAFQNLIVVQFRGISAILKMFAYTKESYAGVGQLYCENPDFRKYYDPYHPQLADFLAKAMKIFAENEL
jgi:hypothetical protein